MSNPAEIFGSKVFNDAIMQQRLPQKTYRQLLATIKNGKTLDPEVANIVANAMKDWAVENGATHFTHWFHPLNGASAESTTALLSRLAAAALSLNFPAPIWFAESPMRLPSRPAVYGQPLKPAAIPLGTRRPMPS